MERARSLGGRRVRKGLQVELLEARRYLAADLSQHTVLEGREYVANELLVQYAPPVFGPQIRFERPSVSLRVEEVIHTKAMQANGLGVMERVKLGSGGDMQVAMQALRKNPNVLYVEPNYIVRKTAVSNDSNYTNGSLWGMYSNDSPTSVGPTGTTNQFGSQAEKAWNENILGSSSVVVGVIDEGVQWNHPDLVDNMWVNPFETAGDGIDNDGNGYVDDIHGWDFVYGNNSVYDVGEDDHGTHVAGTIGGTGGNGIGVVGVNWDVTMISLKFLGPNGGSTSNAVKALDYLWDLKTRHGINIVASNNSWGGGGYSPALHSAIIRNAKADILFVAAAGNGGGDQIGDSNDSAASYPSNYSTTVGTSTESAASYDSVIAVASITSSGAISSFSNFGATTVDIGAPGSGIWSTVGGSGYASYSGTSMATPHVTGAVALYASTQPSGTSAASIKQAILQSATPTASLAGKTVTGSRLNVWDAVQPRSSIQVSSPSPSATTTEAGGTVTFTVVLGAAPTADVTIPVTSSDTTEGTVNASSLVFTSANWNIPQTVTVAGVDDRVDDGNVSYSIVLGVVVSSDPLFGGVNPTDVALINQDDDTAGIIVLAPSGTATTEAGGSVSFTVRLQSQPTANVTIPISSSDTTEGTVSASSLLFTASNWDTEQTVTVTGVDDAAFDGNVIYAVVLGAATSADGLYSGRNPADISLTNIDDDPAPSTKFYVVNDATTDRTYEYGSGGESVENYVLNSSNTAPRGVATNVAGDRVWVVDNNRRVFVYNNSGALLGSWTAGSLPSNAQVEGVTTDGTHVWIVDNRGDRVYYYANAASRLSGTQNATSNFLLNSANRNPRDLVTDGAFLWVVNDASTNVVFRYNLSGVLQNSWSLNSANATPTGITLDPSNGSQDIWVVDSGTDRVYRYANARVSTAPTLTSFFQLAAGNTNPQGIADPPAAEAFGSVEIFVDASESLNSELGWVAPIVGVGSVGVGSSMLSETRDLVFGPKEVSPERSLSSLIVHRDSPVDSRGSLQGVDVGQRMGPKLPRATERLSRGKASLDVDAQLHDLALADLNLCDF